MSEERIALTGKAKETVAEAVTNINQINQALSNFVQGYISAKELKETWNLDIKTMELVKQEPKKE